MRGTIDGIEVYLDEDQLPAFTLSVNSLTDPSKVQGVRSTTIRIIATPEARRVLGTEYMAQLPRSGKRPVLRIGDGSVDVFRAEVVPVKWTRDVIECLAVGGSAIWFDYAKGTKLSEMDLGISSIIDSDYQRATWLDETDLLYFPLVDYGGFEGRPRNFDITIDALRPSVRIGLLVEKAFAKLGYTVNIVGELRNHWPRFIHLDPRANIRSVNDWAATQAAIIKPRTPDTFTLTKPVTGDPGWMSASPSNGSPLFNTADIASAQRFKVPYDTRLQVEMRNVTIEPVPAALDGQRLRLVLYEKTQNIPFATMDTPVLSSSSPNIFSMFFPDVYVGKDMEINVGWWNYTGSDQNILMRGSSPMRILFVPLTGPYTEGLPIEINSCVGDMSLAEVITALVSNQFLVIDTNEETKTVTVQYDQDFYRKSGTAVRDWSERMVHNTAPAKLMDQSTPKRIAYRFKADNDDIAIVRQDAIVGQPDYGNQNQSIDGLSGESTITIPYAATAMGFVLGGLRVPVMRRKGGIVGTDDYGRQPRLLYANGVTPGEWRHDGDPLADYPKCYFVREKGAHPIAFGNAVVYGDESVKQTVDTFGTARHQRMRSPVLTAYFHLRDNELQDFDFGMPTLVDDGSGPAWYWVQEIRDHRFGAGLPTKVTLVKIPGMEYQPPANPPVEFPEPPEPFVCEGPGTASIVVAPGGGTKLFVSQGTSTHFTIRGPSQTFTWPINAPDGIEIGDGPWCIYASDAEGNQDGSIHDIQLGMYGDNDLLSVDLSRMNDLEDVSMILIGPATTFTPFNGDLKYFLISGAALISVLPSFSNIDGLQSFSIDNMSVLSALPDFSPDALASLYIHACPYLAGTGTLPKVSNLDIADTGITDPAVVDALVNALHPASAGIATFNGLLSLRTSASDTNYNACISAGWTII